MSLQVAFGSKPVNDNTMILPADVRKKCSICWSAVGLFTLIIVEYKQNRLHFLATNIPDNRIQEGQILSNYVLPDSPGSYTIDLLKQSDTINISTMELENFDYAAFLKGHQLKPVGRIRFKVDYSAPKFTSETY